MREAEAARRAVMMGRMNRAVVACVCGVVLCCVCAGPSAAQEGPSDRLVMVYSGGISKGAYQAGVSYLLMRELIDKRPEPSDAPYTPGRLKAITGASAGNINTFLSAMTWCQDTTRHPLSSVENLFYESWVNVGWDQIIPDRTTWDAYLERDSFTTPKVTERAGFPKPRRSIARSPKEQDAAFDRPGGRDGDDPVYSDQDFLASRYGFMAVERHVARRLDDPGRYLPGCAMPLGITVAPVIPDARRPRVIASSRDVLGMRRVVPLVLRVDDARQLRVYTNPPKRSASKGAVFTQVFGAPKAPQAQRARVEAALSHPKLGQVLQIQSPKDAPRWHDQDAFRALTSASVLELFKASSANQFGFAPVMLRPCREAQAGEAGSGGGRCPEGLVEESPKLFFDGGTFDNLPIGLGVVLAEESYPAASARGRLTVSYVEPGRRRGVARGAVSRREARSVSFGLSKLGDFYTEASEYELQAVQRRSSDAIDYTLSSRRYPIVGTFLASFGAFLHRDFRLYDYRLGLYDALIALASCDVDAHTGSQSVPLCMTRDTFTAHLRANLQDAVRDGVEVATRQAQGRSASSARRGVTSEAAKRALEAKGEAFWARAKAAFAHPSASPEELLTLAFVMRMFQDEHPRIALCTGARLGQLKHLSAETREALHALACAQPVAAMVSKPMKAVTGSDARLETSELNVYAVQSVFLEQERRLSAARRSTSTRLAQASREAASLTAFMEALDGLEYQTITRGEGATGLEAWGSAELWQWSLIDSLVRRFIDVQTAYQAAYQARTKAASGSASSPQFAGSSDIPGALRDGRLAFALAAPRKNDVLEMESSLVSRVLPEESGLHLLGVLLPSRLELDMVRPGVVLGWEPRLRFGVERWEAIEAMGVALGVGGRHTFGDANRVGLEPGGRALFDPWEAQARVMFELDFSALLLDELQVGATLRAGLSDPSAPGGLSGLWARRDRGALARASGWGLGPEVSLLVLRQQVRVSLGSTFWSGADATRPTAYLTLGFGDFGGLMTALLYHALADDLAGGEQASGAGGGR